MKALNVCMTDTLDFSGRNIQYAEIALINRIDVINAHSLLHMPLVGSLTSSITDSISRMLKSDE
jgi:hypothetical protein